MRSVRVVQAGLAMIALMLGLGAPSSAAPRSRHSTAPLILHPSFRFAGTSMPLTDGRYNFFPQQAPGGLIEDQKSGKRFTVSPAPDCPSWIDGPLMGGPWVFYECSSMMELFSVPAGPWHGVSAGPLYHQCAPDDSGTCQPVAVGADWIQILEQCKGCFASYTFENIHTQTFRSDPTGPATVPDLDSPGLTRRVCTPVRVPTRGSLTFEGRFVLIYKPSAPSLPPGSGSYALARCGTKLYKRIGALLGVVNSPNAKIAASRHIVIWTAPTRSQQLTGLFLPSLRRFVIRLPSRMGIIKSVLLTGRHLYVSTLNAGSIGVWAAMIAAQ